MIRVREKGLSEMDDCICITREHNQSSKSLNECVRKVLMYISEIADINLQIDLDNVGGRGDFVNSSRDMPKAIKLRDAMTQKKIKRV